MKGIIVSIVSALLLFTNLNAIAEVSASGYFIARAICPAYQSFKKQTNPGNITIKRNYAYDIIAKNKKNGSQFLIRIDAKPNQRWVHAACGEHVIAIDKISQIKETADQYVLAVSWQPAFCEKHSEKTECQNQQADDFEASHFSLHGLWPQPKGNNYCNVPKQQIKMKWSELPTLALSENTRTSLKKIMPGYESYLHRHEWTKHGTCYNNKSAEQYFSDSIKLINALNTSDVQQLFSQNINQEITAAQISNAFNQAFGDGAGKKIKISCKQDGNRQLITELMINLAGDLGTLNFQDAISKGPGVNKKGCGKGIIDPVGEQ